MIGKTIGNYEITALLGKGGMGEVYRARDTKLKREVAIKVLPNEFSNDHDRVSRFQREAEVLATLNHPNIATIYDLQEAADSRFLVLELVEGETLADRIKRGPLPIEEALGIAKQICEALEAAHKRGIIHRDLKPGNVKITPDRKVKVLDFGLAKAMQPTLDNAALSNSPTMSMAATNAGMILGTAAYMSPEQAKGLAADARSDVFAFGCVLYEMLTGRAVFEGETVNEILAGVLKAPPNWNRLSHETPEAVHRLLRRCLQKDPARRLRDIADARLELEEDLLATSEPSRVSESRGALRNRRRERIAWVISGVAIAVAILFGILKSRPVTNETPVTWLSILPPSKEFARSAAPAISPDGRRVAFWAPDQTGQTQIWVRSLDSAEARLLPGTQRSDAEQSNPPFWSPDGKSLGFFAQGKLKRIGTDGSGSPQELAETNAPRGGSWNSDDIIIYVPALSGDIYRIAASGGTPNPLARMELPAGEAAWCVAPHFLPDGQHFVVQCSGQSDEHSGAYIASLESSRASRLTGIRSVVQYASGYLFFGRGTDLFAQEFDTTRLELHGQPIRIAEGVGFNGGMAEYAFSVSAQGSVALWKGRAQPLTQLTWFDRKGQNIGVVGSPAEHVGLALTADEKQVAFEFHDTQANWIDIMRVDLLTGIGSRVTTRAGAFGWGAHTPIWSPDGRGILFGDQAGKWTLQDVASNRIETMFQTDAVNWLSDWSPDGKFVIYFADSEAAEPDLWVLPMSGERVPRKYLASPHTEWQARFAPNSRWIAYSSNEDGSFGVYLQSFPDPGGPIRISPGGGTRPMWDPAGNELYYIGGDNKLMTVSLDMSGSRPQIRGTPTPLFTAPLTAWDPGRPQYFPVSSGERFLFNVQIEDPTRRAIEVLLNWQKVVDP